MSDRCPAEWIGMTKWMAANGEQWELGPVEGDKAGSIGFYRKLGKLRVRMAIFNPDYLNHVALPLDKIAMAISGVFNGALDVHERAQKTAEARRWG